MVYDLADIERRLDAGEGLLIGEAAALLHVGRSTIDRLIRRGTIRYQVRAGPGAYRECHPEDVRRLLDEYRQVHRDGE